MGALHAVLNTLKRAKVLPYELEKTSYRFESCSDYKNKNMEVILSKFRYERVGAELLITFLANGRKIFVRTSFCDESLIELIAKQETCCLLGCKMEEIKIER